MSLKYYNEGDIFKKSELVEMGFDIIERDYRKRNKENVNSGEVTADFEYVFDFSGFLINDSSEICAVFPINFKVYNEHSDTKLLFNVISKHLQLRPEIYFGSEYGKHYKSNYPFAAFFEVYNYYEEYGLYFEEKKLIKPNIGGKINWKETIRRSDKYLINNQLYFFPFYYEKSYQNIAFLTEAMIFVINHTIDKFNFMIDMPKVDGFASDEIFLNNREGVLEKLYSIRQETFKDILINLIDNLINYFSNLKEGGTYYLKHYTFSSIWEDAVKFYLENHFKEVKDGKLKLESTNTITKFEKPAFRPNMANNNHFFSPDYYFSSGENQFIFDAKYKREVNGMDYKQISYFLFLKNKRENLNDLPIYSFTHSALILPGVKRDSKLHFKMDPIFNKENDDLVIYEEYLDIREV
ncbi:hypothetical protein I2L58_003004, partial [Listeria monocytogenes]|nr:hypothetical protein [Listeria monocytogenes]